MYLYLEIIPKCDKKKYCLKDWTVAADVPRPWLFVSQCSEWTVRHFKQLSNWMSLARCNSVMKSFQKYDVKIALLSRRNENESLLLPIIQPKARIQIQVHTKIKLCTTVYTQYGFILKLGFQKNQFLPFFSCNCSKFEYLSKGVSYKTLRSVHT